MDDKADVVFDAPGPGMWQLDRSHYPGGTTPLSQWLMQGCPQGMRRAFAELGMPADTLDVRFVNGFMYTRLRPLIRPDAAPMKPPPAPVLKLAVRLHPEMRRRSKAAARALTARPWRKVVDDWHADIRPRLEARNAALVAVDVASLDDAALADHLAELLFYCRENVELHFWLHAFDLGPIGMLVSDCERWGITAAEIVPALAGASPSTSAPARALAELRQLIAATKKRPRTIEAVRALSPEIAQRLDDYLALRGPMLVTRYDIDGETLAEQPHALLQSILHGSSTEVDPARAEAAAAVARAKVPAGEQAAFDERLAEARASMDLRDDNGPNTVELPVGLLRRGLLEAGRRLAAAGRISEPGHALELHAEEVVDLMRHGHGPDAATLAARAERRARLAELDPPRTLGPHEAPPPLDVLTAPHQELVGAVQAVLAHLGMAAEGDGAAAGAAAGGDGDGLNGTGVGTETYRGRARVAHSPEDALSSMEPGDVLVVRFTTPAFNTVLTIAGAVVTADGAILSHAAVMARELGIPAVIGARTAMTDIPDGATVEVDPATGQVRVLTTVG